MDQGGAFVNYPPGVKPFGVKNSAKTKSNFKKSPVLAGNRGMSFEADINDSNAYYRDRGLCLITKRPTPINVVKVDYTHGAIITKAYFETQSTTDYNGVCEGHYIDFEAKSTRSKTSFPLANIPPQQIEHLKKVLEQKGIAFFLIHFELLGKTFLVPASVVIAFYEERPRASMTLEFIEENGRLIPETFSPRYDYLPVLKELFFEK